MPAGSDLFDPLEREKLAKEYGFRQIGEPVPDDVTLKQVVDTIPPEVRGTGRQRDMRDCGAFCRVLLLAAGRPPCSGFLPVHGPPSHPPCRMWRGTQGCLPTTAS